jgi:hypothetical protein
MLLYPSASPVGGSDLSLAPGGAPALSVRFVDLSPDLTTVAGQAKLIEQLRELLKEGVASGGPP